MQCALICAVCFNWSHWFEFFISETQAFEIDNLRVELSSHSTVVEGILKLCLMCVPTGQPLSRRMF